jgi:hypothetical protein
VQAIAGAAGLSIGLETKRFNAGTASSVSSPNGEPNMKIKSPKGLLALWTAFLAAGTWILPTAALTVGAVHSADAAPVASTDSPRLIYLDDVLVQPDERAGGNAIQQICDRLGVPVAANDGAGLVAEGSLSRGLDFTVMSGEADTGFRLQFQLDSRLVLHSRDAALEGGRKVSVRTMLFSGSAAHGSRRIGVLGLAIITSVAALPNNPARSATIVLPLGETWHAGLASAFVRQTEALLREASSGDSADGSQDSGGGGIECHPACQCQCGREFDACKRIAMGAFWVCVGAAVVLADAIILGACLIGCAAANVAFAPCFFGCARIVAGAALAKIKECFAACGAMFLACELGLSGCIRTCP